MEAFFFFFFIIVKIEYILCWIMFMIYLYIKYKRRRYIFSIFNINTLIIPLVVTFLLIGPFQYSDEAWYALGISDSFWFIEFLDKAYIINMSGFIVFLCCNLLFEFKSVNNKFEFNIIKISNSISSSVILVLDILIILLWYILVISKSGTLPIFGDRLFATKSGVQTIYNILNTLISMFGIYYFIKFIQNNKKIYFFLGIINIITLFFTANRGPVIFMALTVVIFYLYYKIDDLKKVNIIIIISMIILLFIGIGMEFIRKGIENINLIETLDSILYGNTFSDLRDGAFILYGYDAKYDDFLYGKTYIADILSFLPKSKIEFRQIWSYGLFTTTTLFGWTNHYGLRGGLFLEAYFNFGYIGVFISAIVLSYITSNLEIWMYSGVIKKSIKRDLSFEFIITDFIKNFSLAIMITSGISKRYPEIIIIICLILISAPIIKNKNIKNNN